MTFPTTGTLDDFNTGASQNLTSRTGWRTSNIIGSTLATDIVPTYASSAAVGGNEWNAVFAADQELTFSFKIPPVGWQAFIRLDVATGNGYYLIQSAAGGNITLNRFVAFGGGPQVGSAASGITVGIGDSIGADCVGTTISVYYKPAAGSWSQIITGTDATFNTSGRIGILNIGTPSTQFDSFGGGAISIGPPGVSTGSFLLLGVGK